MMTFDKKNRTLVDFDPFSGDTIEKIFPSTEPQKEIFASCALGGHDANLAYNESLTIYLTGKLNVEALREALVELHLRHESFRATFTEDGSKMIIYESRPIELSYQDLEYLDSSSQQKSLDRFLENDAKTHFDLFNGPLVRTALFRLNSDSSALVITAHHIVCDGWSSGILLEDLSRLYNARCSGVLYPPAPLLFSDYLKRSVAHEQTEEYQQTLNYWTNIYSGDVPVFEVTPDYPRPPLRTYKARRDDLLLPANIAEAAKKMGARYGCSFVTTLMSAFEILLYKYTGNPDIIIGLPTAGQAVTEMYDLVGHCVNFLPLRSNPAPDVSFADYLKKRKSQTLADYEHQQFTFGTLVKKLKVRRDASRIPLTPVSFNIDIGMNKKVVFDNLTYKMVINKRISETFEIFLNITDSDDGYLFQWSYNTQLFKPATIAGLMEKYIYLLEQVIRQPELLIEQLSLIDEQGVIDQVKDWNQTYKKIPDLSIVDVFETVAEKNPDATALKFGDETFSYKQLNERVNQKAHFLMSQGVKKGDIVGIALERSAEVVESMIAVLKCGAAYLPIDTGFPQDRILLMLEDAEVSLLIVSKALSAILSTPKSRQVIIEDVRDAILGADVSNPGIKVLNTELAYLLYTSGSTGIPKGVMISQRNLLNFLLGMKDIFKTGTHTRLLSVTTISFDIAGLEIFLPLISGGELILADKNATKEGRALLHLLTTGKINIFQATPATYKLLLQESWKRDTSLTLLCGGEALPKNLADALLKKCGRLFNMYGPTETTIWSTVKEIKASDEVISIGRPIQNTSVYILDENHKIVPTGTEGEIFIGGAGVAVGYYQRPELDEQRFIPDPFSAVAGERLYKTGDIGKYLPNGDLICMGRSDNQAKIRGYRIELEEIEFHISKLEGVKDVVTKVEEFEGGDQKLIAYIILSDASISNGNATKNEIVSWRKQLGRSLPDYMIPDSWIKLKQFPLTPNKKVDRKALSLNRVQEHTEKRTVKASGELDDLIAKIKNIWEQELHIGGIEPNDNFFELGGHSMIAIKVMTRIEKETGANLPISTLFDNTTVQALAEFIDANKNPDYSKVVIPIKDTGTKDPIFIVHAGGLNVMIYKSLGKYFDDDQPFYGLQGLGMDGDLSHLDSVESIAKRYLEEMLRYEVKGPYIVMGYSFGGIIAFEIAKQLLDMGKKVKMLGILDTDAFMGDKYKSKLKLYTVKGLRQFRKIAFYTKQLFTVPQDFFKYQWIFLNKKFNKNYQMPEAHKLEIFDYGKEVILAYEQAYNNYELKPIDIEIDLFKGDKKTVYFNVDDEYLSWRKYANKGVKRHIVHGDHFTILYPPNNIGLARKIQEVVNSKK